MDWLFIATLQFFAWVIMCGGLGLLTGTFLAYLAKRCFALIREAEARSRREEENG